MTAFAGDKGGRLAPSWLLGAQLRRAGAPAVWLPSVPPGVTGLIRRIRHPHAPHCSALSRGAVVPSAACRVPTALMICQGLGVEQVRTK